MSPQSNRKPALGQRSTSKKKHVTSTSCKLEPAIWSLDTGQRIPCFDRCQLIITWMFNIKDVHGKPRLHCQPIIWSMATMLRDSVVVTVVRMRPQAIPLAMITMRKSTHGFPFLLKLQTNLDIWKSRGLTLLGKVLIIKSLGLCNLHVMYSMSNVNVP